MKAGAEIYLIGVGPGAADLLTLRAVRAIGCADTLFVDALIGSEILNHARADAKIVAVGKRAGGRITPQQFIQRAMLRCAREGQIVGRIKGGDPMIFGRGGEEAEFLRSQGFEPEVIPGISAAIAVPATLGIPLTHRDDCHGVTLVTGRTKDNEEPDWSTLANVAMTLVIYMGLSRIESIQLGLLNAGMDPLIPAAVIAHGTLADKRQVIGCLQTIGALARSAQLDAPALIVIGNVVRHAREDLLTTFADQYGHHLGKQFA